MSKTAGEYAHAASKAHRLNAEFERANAVAAAVTLIEAAVAGTSTLASELENLGTYADQIQEALKVK